MPNDMLQDALTSAPQHVDESPVSCGDEYLHIFQNASLGIYRSSPDGKQIRANPALVTLNGYSEEAELLANVHDIAQEWYVDPTRRAEFKRLLETYGRVQNFESEIYRHKTRERIWVNENAWIVQDKDGKTLYYEGTVEDISERKRQQIFQKVLIQFVEDALSRGLDESFYGRLLERAVAVVPGAQAGSILLKDASGQYHFAAAVNFNFEGLKPIAFDGHELLVDLDTLEPQIVYGYSENPNLDPQRLELLATYGRIDELKASISVPIVLDSKVAAFLHLDNFEHPEMFTQESIDMTRTFAKQVGVVAGRLTLEHRLAQANTKLVKLANFDSLTGLPNRSLFANRLAQVTTSRMDKKLSLLYLDLDGFKEVNDSLGHSFGDQLLKKVAERLLNAVRSEDTVARLGGDEFAILICLDAFQNAVQVAQNVLDRFKQPFVLAGNKVYVSVSIGIAHFPEHTSDGESLTDYADKAMYQAKARGKNCYSVYSPNPSSTQSTGQNVNFSH